MDILSKIVRDKLYDVEDRKSQYPLKKLELSPLYSRIPFSLGKSIKEKNSEGIIAEYKTKSPSKGIININADVGTVTVGYVDAGASALSVLTDTKYFGGSFENLKIARNKNLCPILQKDFIIDEYQVVEAKSAGADAILLIAAILDKERVSCLATLAQNLGMEVLLEVHSEDELEMINSNTALVGVNNRDLKTFITDIEQSLSIVNMIPDNLIKISESGISSVADVSILKSAGFDGFLIGENFMRSANPVEECRKFIRGLKSEDNAI